MPKEHSMEARALKTGYDNRVIIDDVNVEIPMGKVSVILGSNGCGKSTLLKTFCRLNRIFDGEILLDGKKTDEIAPKEFACTVGLMPQSPLVPEGITVYDLVSRGRFPYRKFMRGLGTEDFQAVKDALEMMEIADMADRPVDELSGGQRQRVWIALALAQQTDILFLDEPTTFLDIAYQVEILDLLTDLNRRRGTTIVMVLHDINLSAKYADYLFAVKKGKLIAQGSPEVVITEPLIRELYGLNCMVISDPVSGSPMIVPIGRYHNGEREKRK
ncbi:MAG: ABC transporter ATP-binding protein [Lachnospiraceae bacterium]|nr:ABC transporter ATP-binding protein [Lachnospiraceae bacterium]